VSAFKSGEPLAKATVIEVLRAHGWHQQDIGDAFYEADPDWLER
jgi:hypothetical protein